jgi:enterochelin esterase-like enzyme
VRSRPAATVLAALASSVLGACSADSTDRHGAEVEHFTIDSRLVHRSMRQTAVVPGGSSADRRPLLVFLHGRGNDENSNLDEEMFSALESLGGRAPVIVFASGGDDSYWHDRGDGAWGRYVLDEVIPQAQRRLRTDPRRVALAGMSMGGFGAYDLARLSPGRFCAVGGHSPALWRSSGETAAGAFDDAADFARHDVIQAARSGASGFRGEALWLDAGLSDPFDPGDKAFVSALGATGVPIRVHRWEGGHERSYWRRHWDEYLSFYARALRRCGRR